MKKSKILSHEDLITSLKQKPHGKAKKITVVKYGTDKFDSMLKKLAEMFANLLEGFGEKKPIVIPTIPVDDWTDYMILGLVCLALLSVGTWKREKLKEFINRLKIPDSWKEKAHSVIDKLNSLMKKVWKGLVTSAKFVKGIKKIFGKSDYNEINEQEDLERDLQMRGEMSNEELPEIKQDIEPQLEPEPRVNTESIMPRIISVGAGAHRLNRHRSGYVERMFNSALGFFGRGQPPALGEPEQLGREDMIRYYDAQNLPQNIGAHGVALGIAEAAGRIGDERIRQEALQASNLPLNSRLERIFEYVEGLRLSDRLPSIESSLWTLCLMITSAVTGFEIGGVMGAGVGAGAGLLFGIFKNIIINTARKFTSFLRSKGQYENYIKVLESLRPIAANSPLKYFSKEAIRKLKKLAEYMIEINPENIEKLSWVTDEMKEFEMSEQEKKRRHELKRQKLVDKKIQELRELQNKGKKLKPEVLKLKADNLADNAKRERRRINAVENNQIVELTKELLDNVKEAFKNIDEQIAEHERTGEPINLVGFTEENINTAMTIIHDAWFTRNKITTQSLDELNLFADTLDRIQMEDETRMGPEYKEQELQSMHHEGQYEERKGGEDYKQEEVDRMTEKEYDQLVKQRIDRQKFIDEQTERVTPFETPQEEVPVSQVDLQVSLQPPIMQIQQVPILEENKLVKINPTEVAKQQVPKTPTKYYKLKTVNKGVNWKSKFQKYIKEGRSITINTKYVVRADMYEKYKQEFITQNPGANFPEKEEELDESALKGNFEKLEGLKGGMKNQPNKKLINVQRIETGNLGRPTAMQQLQAIRFEGEPGYEEYKQWDANWRRQYAQRQNAPVTEDEIESSPTEKVSEPKQKATPVETPLPSIGVWVDSKGNSVAGPPAPVKSIDDQIRESDEKISKLAKEEEKNKGWLQNLLEPKKVVYQGDHELDHIGYKKQGGSALLPTTIGGYLGLITIPFK